MNLWTGLPIATAVTPEVWAHYVSSFRCECTQARDDLMLVRLRTSRAVIAMVKVHANGTKKYVVRPGATRRHPEDAAFPKATLIA